MKATAAAFSFALAAATPAAAQSAAAPAGAAACSGCHAPAAVSGAPVAPLFGRVPADIVMAMQEFRTGKRPSTVMDRIAKGFTDEEASAIAAWLAAQKARAPQ